MNLSKIKILYEKTEGEQEERILKTACKYYNVQVCDIITKKDKKKYIKPINYSIKNILKLA
jgi:chromosomal replication initiation ATPase DnaA